MESLLEQMVIVDSKESDDSGWMDSKVGDLMLMLVVTAGNAVRRLVDLECFPIEHSAIINTKSTYEKLKSELCDMIVTLTTK